MFTINSTFLPCSEHGFGGHRLQNEQKQKHKNTSWGIVSILPGPYGWTDTHWESGSELAWIEPLTGFCPAGWLSSCRSWRRQGPAGCAPRWSWPRCCRASAPSRNQTGQCNQDTASAIFLSADEPNESADVPNKSDLQYAHNETIAIKEEDM